MVVIVMFCPHEIRISDYVINVCMRRIVPIDIHSYKQLHMCFCILDNFSGILSKSIFSQIYHPYWCP